MRTVEHLTPMHAIPHRTTGAVERTTHAHRPAIPPPGKMLKIRIGMFMFQETLNEKDVANKPRAGWRWPYWAL